METGAWGGLSLTFIVSAFALILCFPVGMLLALGRRSTLPVIKYSSIGFIELWRRKEPSTEVVVLKDSMMFVGSMRIALDEVEIEILKYLLKIFLIIKKISPSNF